MRYNLFHRRGRVERIRRRCRRHRGLDCIVAGHALLETDKCEQPERCMYTNCALCDQARRWLRSLAGRMNTMNIVIIYIAIIYNIHTLNVSAL